MTAKMSWRSAGRSGLRPAAHGTRRAPCGCTCPSRTGRSPSAGRCGRTGCGSPGRFGSRSFGSKRSLARSAPACCCPTAGGTRLWSCRLQRTRSRARTSPRPLCFGARVPLGLGRRWSRSRPNFAGRRIRGGCSSLPIPPARTSGNSNIRFCPASRLPSWLLRLRFSVFASFVRAFSGHTRASVKENADRMTGLGAQAQQHRKANTLSPACFQIVFRLPLACAAPPGSLAIPRRCLGGRLWRQA